MRIGVLTYFPFPKGMAPTTRIIAYCKGLQTNGVDVEVFSCCWNPDNQGIPIKGEVEGVPFQNSHLWQTKRGKLYKITIDKYFLYRNTYKKIRESHEKAAFDYILVACDMPSVLKSYLPKLHKIGIKLIYIVDEYPHAIRELKNAVPKRELETYRSLNKYFKGRILMTKALQKFYDEYVGELPTHIMCSILDESRFENVTPFYSERRYLCYMGNLSLKKDDVCTIIKAFALIKDDYADLDLFLFGNENTKEDGDKLRCLIKELALVNRVFLKGRVDYECVPSILAGATILVTAQPVTKRAEGGFPTKMGEYMMSRRPMIVTNVGEISQYISDGVDAYIVDPENPVSYAQKLDYILKNYDKTNTVVENAYEKAMHNFTAKCVASDVITFLNELH